MPRRPRPRDVGVVVLAGVLVLLAAACSGPVDLDAPPVRGSAARACAALVEALPDDVADLARVESDAGGGYGAAWGDPAIVLRCGVGRPAGLEATSQCQEADGVDWFIPPSQQDGSSDVVTMTTVGRQPGVEVEIPADHFPPAATMVDLAPAIKATTRSVRPCL